MTGARDNAKHSICLGVEDSGVASRVYSTIAWKSHKRIIRIRVGQNNYRA